MTVHLHIGAGKVGSTTIQHAAARHQATLAAAGLLYPVNAVWRRSHAALAQELRGRAGTGSLELLRATLAAHDGDVLLSSEFFNAVPRPGVEALRDALGDRPARIIMYLRPYPDWVRAAYSQQAKRGRFLEDFDHFCAGRTVRFGSRLATWAGVFGWSSVHVRTVDEIGGDVLGDLSALLGVALPTVAPANVSPAWTAVETARWLAARGRGGVDLPAVVARVDAAHRELGLPLQADYLTGDQRRTFTEQWRADLERISAATGRALPAPASDERSRPWLPTFERVPEALRALAL